MCPSAAAINGNGTTNGEVPHVPTTNGPAPAEYQAVDSHAPSAPEVAEKKHQSNPYASRASDFLSNVSHLDAVDACSTGPVPGPRALSLVRFLSRDSESTLEGHAQSLFSPKAAPSCAMLLTSPTLDSHRPQTGRLSSQLCVVSSRFTRLN